MAQHLDIDMLYRQHGAWVLRRARQLLGNEAEAQEALQDVFLSLMSRPEQFSGSSSITTFLYSMTTHLCLNRLRDFRNRSRLVEQHLEPLSKEGQPRSEELSAVRQILARLPDREAQLLIHYYVDEMTQDEIAEAMGIPRRQVGRLLERAQEELRKQERLAC
jgi:RNA polymerase sigma-70 factor (ECF subfamily)